MDKINWGIIGCGDVAEIKSGPAFQRIEHSSLQSVMRRNGEKARDFAQRHNVPHWTDNADDILLNEDINAVYIATPPSTHLDYALRALNQGKHVYLEKPMALDAMQAKKIRNAVAANKGKLTVAHYRRKLPAFLKVKTLLEQKKIGTVTHVDIQLLQSRKTDIVAASEANWRLNPEISGGGYFYDLAPHQIDLMYHYFGPVQESVGFSQPSGHHTKVEDIVNGIVQFKNGVQFRGLWNFNSPPFNNTEQCTIYGTKGSIAFSFFGDQVHLTSQKGNETFSFKNPKHIQEPMIRATVDYFVGKAENPCSAEEGLLVMKVMESLMGRTS
ncbi:Gfo/Idh/MocA family protein [Maribacter thermophilus]|uniref:Gfo/Idh/MocA family protein n=1 Tax=Maribacter thermophilus TaxID=1197874 RepID=UPI0006410B3A|nr:Gfo/Idh/MocA family oxidoreductase [Maribacter thermophilus]